MDKGIPLADLEGMFHGVKERQRLDRIEDRRVMAITTMLVIVIISVLLYTNSCSKENFQTFFQTPIALSKILC